VRGGLGEKTKSGRNGRGHRAWLKIKIHNSEEKKGLQTGQKCQRKIPTLGEKQENQDEGPEDLGGTRGFEDNEEDPREGMGRTGKRSTNNER